MSRKLIAISVVLLLFVCVLALWPDNEKAATRSVTALPEAVAAEGRVAVRPDRRAVLSAEVGGRIERIEVDNLTPVLKGQLLAVLYNADLERRIRQTEEFYRKAQAYHSQLVNGSRKEDIEEAAALVRKAESDLEFAQRNEERDRKLHAEEVIAQSQLDATLAKRKGAEAELQAALGLA